jgi:aldehyde dehydrogenase (NAD+)
MASVPQPRRSTGEYSGFDRQPIAGSWRAGRGKGRLADRNPYTGATLLEIALADQQDLDEAYAGAAKAQKAWAARLPGERAEVMRTAARVMEARHDEIVSWLIAEAGSTRIKAELEFAAVRAVMLEASYVPYRMEGRILPSDVPGKECRVYRQPVGVVAVISPWNWPLQLSNRSVAPALAAGNAVVLKPASDTPVTGGLLLAKLYEEAGLPPGVLSVVVGAGAEIGDAFVSHPVPRVVSFTGSTPVGRGIGRLAAEAPIMKRVARSMSPPNTALDRPKVVALASASASSSLAAGMFGATGPKISSRAMSMSLRTSATTCGGSTWPCALPPRVSRAPLLRASAMRSSSPRSCFSLMIGPTSVSGSFGSPTLSLRARSVKRSTNAP